MHEEIEKNRLPIPTLGRPESSTLFEGVNGTLLVFEDLGKVSYQAFAEQVIAEEKASKSLTEDAVL
jgi:hypothetical protein